MAFLRSEEADELTRRGAREFLEQRGAIVRRHLVQDRDDLLVGHAAKQLLLRVYIDVEILEDICGQHVRQDAEDDDLLVLRQIENDLGHIGRRHLGKELAQRGEIPRVDQALDFGQ